MPSNIFSNLIPQVYVVIPESLIFEQILLLPIKTCFSYFRLFQRIHVFWSWTFGSPERHVLIYTKVCSLKVFLCSLKVFFNGYLLMFYLTGPEKMKILMKLYLYDPNILRLQTLASIHFNVPLEESLVWNSGVAMLLWKSVFIVV